MSWRKGPLPANTWNWGGVVPVGEDAQHGFYFADFKGDSVELVGVDGPKRVLKPDEVAWYNNSLELPPHDNPNVKGTRLGCEQPEPAGDGSSS